MKKHCLTVMFIYSCFSSKFKNILLLFALVFPRKFLTTSLNDIRAFFSCSDIVQMKCLSIMNCRICGPSNTPAFIFLIERPGNAQIRHLKQSPTVGKASTNCFIRPSFMCRCDNIILFLSTSGSYKMLGSPCLKSDLGCQFISTIRFSRDLLSHMHRKQGYFLYPRCRPRRNATILRSTQMIQLCLWDVQISPISCNVMGRSCICLEKTLTQQL